MRTAWIGILTIGCVALPVGDAPVTVEQFDAVVRIRNAAGGNGSGVVIGYQDGRATVLSCGHVAALITQPTVGFRGQEYAGTWLAASAKPDLAVLAFYPLEQVTLLEIADKPVVGQRVTQIGYAHGYLFHSRGEVQADNWHTDCDLTTSAYTMRGMSGGPILDARGRVLGVITSLPHNMRGVGLGVSCVTIRKWLAEQKIHP